MARLRGSSDVARYHIARNRVICDEAAHHGFRVNGEIPQVASASITEFLLEHILIDALTSDHLATIASRCAGAHPLSFENGDAKSTCAQVQRRRQSRVAAADDADVEALIALERRAL